MIREYKEMTLAEVAERADMAPAALSRIENGRVENPHLRTLERIADALEVETWELLYRPKVERRRAAAREAVPA